MQKKNEISVKKMQIYSETKISNFFVNLIVILLKKNAEHILKAISCKNIQVSEL